MSHRVLPVCLLCLIVYPFPAQAGLPELNSTLEAVRKEHDVPALAAAVVRDGKVAAVGAVGVRKYGTDIKVTPEDQFHIGSCTKAMTATLIARLVEDGKLRWDTTLEKGLPDLAKTMDPAYQKVTLEQLLTHRAGLPPPEATWPKDKQAFSRALQTGSVIEQRLRYAELMLRQPPEPKPGTKYVYSNASYILAGAMAEHATGSSWEELAEKMIFKPLGMKSAGFGPMGTMGKIDQPLQHRLEGTKHIPLDPGYFSDNPPLLGPAGRVHCSVGDWAKFAIDHMREGRGKNSLLKRSSYQKLHSPPTGSEYAGGWIVVNRDWAGGTAFNHGGSNSFSYAVVWIAPRRSFAALAMTNQGGDAGRKACDAVIEAVIKQYLVEGKK
jgi:CubicO group peptidase (beta-lactamase class C family)